MSGFVPDVGDIVWLQFDPQAGHEQVKAAPPINKSIQIHSRPMDGDLGFGNLYPPPRALPSYWAHEKTLR